MPLKDLTGQHFGKLTVVGRADSSLMKTGEVDTLWWCRCECGKMVVRPRGSLRNGGPYTSCGCSKLTMNITHGMTYSPLYDIYYHMRGRCTNPKMDRYPDYGGRGIKVCDEWMQSFTAFADWALNNGYRDGLSIERKDVNGDYCPENCTWIPKKEQWRNRRDTVWADIRGERLRPFEIAEKYGLSEEIIRKRIRNGDTGEAIIRPYGKKQFRRRPDSCKPPQKQKEVSSSTPTRTTTSTATTPTL